MGSSGRSAGWALLLLLPLGAACSDRRRPADTARVPTDTTRASTPALRQPEDEVPERLLTVTESMAPEDGFAQLSTTYLDPVAAEGSLLERAQAVLAAARPGFREWPAAKYEPVRSGSAGPRAIAGRLVGDFDGDGMPDVVFDGHDGDTAVTIAVLSNNGRPTVASVNEEPHLPDPRTTRGVRFAGVSYTLNRARGVGVGLVYYDPFGGVAEGPIFIYREGRFTQIVVGE